MRKQHTTTAVSAQIQTVKRVTFGIVGLQESKIGVPFVADHLAARKASNGDNHRAKLKRLEPKNGESRRIALKEHGPFKSKLESWYLLEKIRLW